MQQSQQRTKGQQGQTHQRINQKRCRSDWENCCKTTGIKILHRHATEQTRNQVVSGKAAND
jgi:hypothetical protein